MAPTIVHFTGGFVLVLGLLWLLPLTKYRLTGAFCGGIWGCIPDSRFLLEGSRAEQVEALHDSQLADVFFLHYTLDQPFFRSNEIELTLLALVALGITLLLYDWRFGRHTPSVGSLRSSSEPPTTDSD